MEPVQKAQKPIHQPSVCKKKTSPAVIGSQSNIQNLTWKLPKYYTVLSTNQISLNFSIYCISSYYLFKTFEQNATGMNIYLRILIYHLVYWRIRVDKIYKALAHIINLSINSSIVPDSWKVAKVVPVYMEFRKRKRQSQLQTYLCTIDSVKNPRISSL